MRWIEHSATLRHFRYLMRPSCKLQSSRINALEEKVGIWLSDSGIDSYQRSSAKINMICQRLNMKFREFGSVLASLLCLSTMCLIGCTKSKEKEPTKQEKISVKCEGIEYRSYENKDGKTKNETRVTTSYVFIKEANGEWTFNEAGGVQIRMLNYDYPDQDGKPKASTTMLVDDQVIKFQQYFWKSLDKQTSMATSSDWALSMNRVTGEWYARRSDDMEWRDGLKAHEIATRIGKCESATPRF